MANKVKYNLGCNSAIMGHRQQPAVDWQTPSTSSTALSPLGQFTIIVPGY